MSDCGDCGGGCDDNGGGYDGGEHYGSDHDCYYEDRRQSSCSSSSPMSDGAWGVLLLLIGGGIGGWQLSDSLQKVLNPSKAVDAGFVSLWLFPMVLLFVAILGLGLLMKGIQRITSKSKQSNFETSFNDTNQGGNVSDRNKFKMGDEETNTIASTTAGIENSSIGKTNPYVVHAQQMEQQPSSNTNQSDSDTKPASHFDQMSKWTSFNNTNTKQNNNDFVNRNQRVRHQRNRNQSRQNDKKPAGVFGFDIKFG